MYTENELQISNESYTNKDFGTIYPELLDLVRKLTDKWDPTTSNESDPGVVLLKLAALIADKNNYNIDKNILEAFPLSVTQVANARKLYDMLGYSMNWYKAADTQISFVYKGADIDGAAIKSVTIPKWTMISDDKSSVVYTLVQDVKLSNRGVAVSGHALQGSIHDYDINGVTTVTLDNLDSDRRLFFTEKFVAENGVFVVNKGSGYASSADYWTKVDNLEATTLGSKVYKFGVLPNSNTCYIQFPQDIGNLIENGLTIKYIITQGVNGNIKSRTLSTFTESIIPKEFQNSDSLSAKSINEDVTIYNLSSAQNGLDPEDIDSAYMNYKKTVGTFDTLVTLRDYENALYTLTNTFDNPMASNVVVSDRTCDLNNTYTLVKRDPQGSYKEQYVTQENNGLYKQDGDTYIQATLDSMTAFDLGLYVLDAVNNVSESANAYNKSFTKSASGDIHDMLQMIEDKSCIQHDYIVDHNSTDNYTYLYKSFYSLRGTVVTYYKVSKTEAEEIEDNIKKALFSRYNARNVNFGQPVNYDDIIQTILNCDTRIKTVVLSEPEYTLAGLAANDTLGDYESRKQLSLDELLALLVKMIVGGNVLLYDFNTAIQFRFGQKGITKYEDVKKITSNTTVVKESLNRDNGYEIKENLNIQLYAPNLYTETSYTSFVNYRIENATTGSLDKTTTIKQNQYYCIPNTMLIRLNYTDSNKTVQTKIIGGGLIIRFSDSSDDAATLNMNGTTVTKNNVEYCTLTASQLIDVMKINQKKFDTDDYLPCMWFTNTHTTDSTGKKIYNVLFAADLTEKILEDNEYFIYTNILKNELVILGSGTMIKRSSKGTSVEWAPSVKESDIIDQGISAVKDDSWYLYTNKDLSIVELQIVTLGKGAGIRCTVKNNLSNSPQSATNVKYCSDYNKKDWESLVTYSDVKLGSETLGWKIRTKLNLMFSNNRAQLLDSSDTLSIVYKDSTPQTPSTDLTVGYIMSNNIIGTSGGIDLELISSDENKTIDFYTYTHPSSTNDEGLPTGITYNDDGCIDISGDKLTRNISLSFSFAEPQTNRKIMIPVWLNTSNSQLNVTIQYEGKYVPLGETQIQEYTYSVTLNAAQPVAYIEATEYKNSDPSSSDEDAQFTGITIVENTTATTTDTLTIGLIFIIDDVTEPSSQVNDTLKYIETNDKNVQTLLREVQTAIQQKYSGFDKVYVVPEEDRIDTHQVNNDSENLFSGTAVFDSNHILNKYVIPLIRTDDSSIKVAYLSISR